jgi:hypothetical protein
MNKNIINLTVFAIALSIFGASFAMAGITGTVDVAIVAATEVSFTTDSFDFGSGTVSGATAVLTSNSSGGATTVTGGSWSPTTGGLVLENTGGVAAAITLNSSTDADSFIGDDAGATFKWKVVNVEADSCSSIGLESFTEIAEGGAGTSACTSLGDDSAADSIGIDFEVTIPIAVDADPAVQATITAIATAA